MKKLSRKISPSLAMKLHKLGCNDLRLGQIMYIVFGKIQEDGKDPFYIENDEMEEYLIKAFDCLKEKGV